ncbi:MAG: preprotein translocase subunit SecE [Clostridia bacterium]|nr:preprotein translocase subunit SecE [Clostridia bacterium]
MAKHEKSEAAEKIEKAVKEKKAGAPKVKKGNPFKRAGKAIVKFCKDFKGETKKITWPGAKMVLKSTLVVLVSIVVIGLVVFAIDLGLSKGVSGLEGLAENYKTSQSADEEKSESAETESTETESSEASAE